jgi:hypothetical protein
MAGLKLNSLVTRFSSSTRDIGSQTSIPGCSHWLVLLSADRQNKNRKCNWKLELTNIMSEPQVLSIAIGEEHKREMDRGRRLLEHGQGLIRACDNANGTHNSNTLTGGSFNVSAKLQKI